jgi:hypothetical protein
VDISSSFTRPFQNSTITGSTCGGPGNGGVGVSKLIDWETPAQLGPGIHIENGTGSNTDVDVNDAVTCPVFCPMAKTAAQNATVDDLQTTTGTPNLVNIGTTANGRNIIVRHLRASGGNLLNDANTGCVIPMSSEPTLAEYVLANSGEMRSTSKVAGCGNVIASVSPVSSSGTCCTSQLLVDLTMPLAFFSHSTQQSRYHASGIYSLVGTPTVTFTLSEAVNTGCATSPVTLATIVTSAATALTNNTWNLNLYVFTTASGTTGTLLVHGAPGLTIDLAATQTAADTVFGDINTGSSGTINLTGSAGANHVCLFVTTSSTSASNHFTQHAGTVIRDF